MIEIYSKDMRDLIGYTIRRYRLSFPSDFSHEDIEQEVAVGLLKTNRPLTAGDVVRHVIWSRARIWKDAITRQHPDITKHPKGINSHKLVSEDPIHAKESVKKILALDKLTTQERDFLKYKSEGLDSKEIIAKMGLNSRQRLEQIKRVAFYKVRHLCRGIIYWG